MGEVGVGLPPFSSPRPPSLGMGCTCRRERGLGDQHSAELVSFLQHSATRQACLSLVRPADCGERVHILILPAFCFPFMPAWNDGKIRAFAPETGRLMYVINNAHRIGVTAIATTSDCKRVISGGGEGEVLKAEI